MEEITTIYNHEFSSKRLEQVRDLFIFSCYTALSYIDVCELRQEDIRTGFDGNLWIIRKRHKTNVTSTVRLLDIPKAILEKYKHKLPTGKILPVISNQKMNDYLKEIAAICGIEKTLTYHVARHSCATSVLLANGVPIETVSKILGHTNIRTTQIYARITDLKVSSDMEILAQKVGCSTQDCQPMKLCYRQITARCDLWHTNLFSVPQNTLGKFTPKSCCQ